MNTAPYTIFGKTADVKVEIYINAKYVDDIPKWEKDLWVERGEDWYAFENADYKGRRVRVITRDEWLRALKRKEAQQVIQPAAQTTPSPSGGNYGKD